MFGFHDLCDWTKSSRLVVEILSSDFHPLSSSGVSKSGEDPTHTQAHPFSDAVTPSSLLDISDAADFVVERGTKQK